LDHQGLVNMLTAVALGEMLNPNLLSSVKFYGSNHLIRRGFVGVIHEIDLVHVVKSCQSVQSLFIIDLGHLNDCEKLSLWRKF
jgi:hypothetical protein